MLQQVFESMRSSAKNPQTAEAVNQLINQMKQTMQDTRKCIICGGVGHSEQGINCDTLKLITRLCNELGRDADGQNLVKEITRLYSQYKNKSDHEKDVQPLIQSNIQGILIKEKVKRKITMHNKKQKMKEKINKKMERNYL